MTSNQYLDFEGGIYDDWRTASLSSDSGPLRRPVSMFTFAINWVVPGGNAAVSVKLVNLGIHLGCGVLVYALAMLLLGRALPASSVARVRQIAWFAAALWLLAPLHVSTVLYSVQRMAQLAALFALAGLVLFVCRRERWSKQGASLGELMATGFWLSLFLLLAVLSKENGVALLWLITVVEVSFFRGSWAGKELPWLRRLGWFAFCAPLVLLGLILYFAPNSLIGGYANRDFSLEERLLTQLRLLWQYIYWLIVPDIDSMGFQHDDIPLSTGWTAPLTTSLAAAGWLLALFLSFLAAKKFPLLIFALLFYLTGHFFESGIWPLEMVYEHRNYIPSVGVFILLAYVLLWFISKQNLVRAGVPIFAVIAMVATLLFLRVHVWAEPLRLSAVNVENHPNSSRSHHFLAESYLLAYTDAADGGDDAQTMARYLVYARHNFERMHQLNPRDMAALVMLYYLDSHHFPELGADNDWYAKLLSVAVDRPLQASDRNALDILTDCFAASACGDAQARFFPLMGALEARYPQDASFAVLKHRYLKETGASLEERLDLLVEANSKQPTNRMVIQSLIVEHSEAGDLTATFDVVLKWLRQDPHRRDLGQIRRLFAPVNAESEESQSTTGMTRVEL